MKKLLITSCSDGMMWYAGLVGTYQTYIRRIDSEGVFLSRDTGGFINIVKFSDAKVVEVEE